MNIGDRVVVVDTKHNHRYVIAAGTVTGLSSNKIGEYQTVTGDNGMHYSNSLSASSPKQFYYKDDLLQCLAEDYKCTACSINAVRGMNL